MSGIKVTLLILILMHVLPVVVTQLLVLEYPFDDRESGKRIKCVSTAANIILNCIALLLVISIYSFKTELNIIKVLNFECSYQDISRIATSDVICLVIAIFIGVGEYVCLGTYYRDKHFLHFSSKYILLFSLTAIPLILGYYYGHSGISDLAINEICRKTTVIDMAEYSGYEGFMGGDGSYVAIINNGDFSYELDEIYLSDKEDELQAKSLQGVIVKPGETYRCFMSGDNSLNIKKSGGTIVYLSDKFGTVIDSVEVPALKRDESYKDSELGWVTVNLAEEYAVKAPVFSAEAGFYDDSFYLTLSSEGGTKIYYTTDSSEPTIDSLQYVEPIFIYDKTSEPNVLFSMKNIVPNYYENWTEQENVDKAFVIRAIAVDDEGNISETVTKTYFVNLDEYEDRRVISLVTDPVNLYGEKGIYVTGDAYDEWYENEYAKLQDNESLGITYTSNANYWQRGIAWERIANIEAFNNTANYLNQPVGIRIQGASSRHDIRKRFSVYARKDYNGSKYFDSSPFGSSDERVHSVVLREGFINSFCQALIEDRFVSTQKSVPVSVFLNGELLYNAYMQEKYNRSYFANRYGLSEENVEVIRIGWWGNLTEEEIADYTSSITDYIEKNDLSYDDKYARFGQIINVQSYIDLACINIYMGNMDVTDAINIAMWRTYTKENDEYGDTRWNWALYDMDLMTYNARWTRGVETDAEVNTFTDSPDFEKDRHFNENPIYVALKANPKFCKQFVLTFMDLVNTTFSVEKVAAKFEEWNEYTIESYNDGFFLNRAGYIVPFMAEEFKLTGTQETVTLSSNISGTPITLNTITPELRRQNIDDSEAGGLGGSYIWSGTYFTDYPVTVTANEPNFSHWEITVDGDVKKYTNTTIEVPVAEGGIQIHAVFK